MSETNLNGIAMPEKEEDMFGAGLDMNIVIDALMKSAEKKPEVETVKVETEKPMTPLERMRERQKQESSMGIEITKDTFDDGTTAKPLKNAVDTEERTEDIVKYSQDMDDKLKKRAATVMIRKPENGQEYSEMMVEIDSVKFDESGKAYFDYKVETDEQILDEEGKPTGKFQTTQLTPKFVRIRTEEDGAFSMENDKQILENTKGKTTEVTSDGSDPETAEEISDEKKQIVEILIDKTGMGYDFAFSEEEKSKIVDADVIKLKEVKTVSLNTLKIKKMDRSFQEIISEHQISAGGIQVCFPSSGFKATMKGLTYGEMADLSIDTSSTPTVDEYYKRLTVVYNKMVNISCGAFKDFEDFLKHFAYADLPLAIYGLLIATMPEIQTIGLTCGDAKCKKGFNWDYATRSLLKFEACGDKVLNGTKDLLDAPAALYDKFKTDADVNNTKLIELPQSKFVLEITSVSCYEFLYNILPITDEETFINTFGKNALAEAFSIDSLAIIKSVYVPMEDGEYVHCEGYKDILDALSNISPTEFQIINGYKNKYDEETRLKFSLGDVKCSHCGAVTKDLVVDIDTMVFRIFQTVLTTQIDV